MTGTETLAARSLVVDVLGLYGRRGDGWTSVRTVVALLGDLGVAAPATRSVLVRLRRRGWIVSESRDGVAGDLLTDLALTSYAERDPLILGGPQVAPAGTAWVVVTASVPEPQRSVRHQLRTRLAAQGFGNTNPGVWMAPAARVDAALAVVDDLGLTATADVVVGHPARPDRLRHAVARGWWLDDLAAGYRQLLVAHPVGPVPSGQEAFVRTVALIHDWRPLVLADPALPRDLMPPDWPAADAASLVSRARATWDDAADAYVRGLDRSYRAASTDSRRA